MAVMPTAAGMARCLSSTPSTSASCPSAAAPPSRPISSFSLSRHQSCLLTSTRQLGSLHLANFARNVPATERKGVTVSPSEPQMSAEELRAYEDINSKLEGTEPDFWEGPQFNGLGFIIQYLWVFGVAVSIIACITAVRTYNLGATDFKNTSVFKEAIEYQADEFADDSSGPSVFEESTKEAP